MEDSKKSKVAEILVGLAEAIGVNSIKMTSELAEGQYTLEDGTTFRIDAEGNLVDVVAPDPAAAEAEEASKAEEEAVEMARQKAVQEEIEGLKKKVAELEAENLQLSKTPKIVPVPKAGKKFEKIELRSDMTYEQRVAARIQNLLNR